MSNRLMTGGQAVIAALEAQGVDTIFGTPGGHSLAIYDALARQNKIRHVLGRHEQGLGFMADGYSRVSGKIGVVTTTSGPAVANLASAMGGATTDTSSVLAIASTVRSELIGKNRGGLHDLNDVIEIMRSVCRYVRRCGTVQEIPGVLSELVYKLRCCRPGGAFCEIPADVLAAKAEVEIPSAVAVERAQPDHRKISDAVRLLATAQRPVIWTGTGAINSNAGNEVKQLAVKLGAIVVTTSLGRGLLPADHPNVVTKDGAFWSAMGDVIAEADVVLAVGTMFKQEDTADWKVKPGDKLIHIDIDPEEIGRSYPADIGIVADAKAALSAILEQLPSRKPAELSWVERGKKAQEKYLNQRRRQAPTEMRALDILRSTVPKDAVIVCDRCNLGYWAWRCMPAYVPRTFQYPMGYGGLGGALPQATGAKLACPEKMVVCVIGDGGFQFTAPELIVAVRENIAFTIVLCNNHLYGAIEAAMNRNFGSADLGCELRNPDFQKFAAAYGVSSVRVNNLDDFEQALEKGIKSKQLNLIELAIDLCDPPFCV